MKYLTRVFSALIALAIFGNFFFFRAVTPLSIGLFLLGLFMYIIVVAEHRPRAMLLLTATALFAVCILWIRATNFIHIISILMLFSLVGSLWYISLSESESFSSFTDVFFTPIFAGLTYLKRLGKLLFPATLFAYYKQGVKLFSNQHTHSRNISTIIGFAIALPVTIILVAMFAAADPIYYSYLKKIFSPEFIQELPWRIILSFLLCGAALPFVFPRIRRIFVSPGHALGQLQMNRELTIVMFVVSLVIASFIIIQWPYVFVNVKAETDLSQFGVATYAEYVKRGFIELLRVSAFVYALLWLGLTALRQPLASKSRLLSILQWVVIGEFFLIVLSIARRVYLYQLYHGLTLIRIYGSFFLVWLGFMALTLAGRHLTRKISFGKLEGIFTILLFIIMGMWNAEQFIVMRHPPTVNKRVDYVYLSRMSADGVDGWIKAYTHAKQTIEKYAETTGELDKNARREIAYAYYVLRRITIQYGNYENNYASASEFRMYVNAVVDFQIESLEKEQRELSVYKRKPDENWVNERIEEIEKIQRSLLEVKTQSLTEYPLLAENKTEYPVILVAHWWRDLPAFEPYSAPRLLSFYESYRIDRNNSYSNYNSQRSIVERYIKTKALDRLYNYNVSDKNAFQIMKAHISLSELHMLQTQYFDLYTRIGKQSARDYESDISLDSPLL